MSDLELTNHQFCEVGYYSEPIPWHDPEPPSEKYFKWFDQEGYDLSNIEILFAIENGFDIRLHRKNETLSKIWYTQDKTLEGAVLNHGLLFERKGFQGKALDQILKWSEENPLFWSLIQMRPKWGIDLSIDYYSPLVCNNREVFECFHYEWDSFRLDESKEMKSIIENLVSKTNFNEMGLKLLNLKKEWYPLDYFARSEFRSNFYKIPLERFKMVPWI